MFDDDKDRLIHFIFDNAPVHGAIVQLEDSYIEVLNRHPYSLTEQCYLGESLAAAALLSMKLKNPGTIILQTQGDGPVNLLLAQVTNKHQRLEIRGLLNSTSPPNDDFSTAFGEGHLAITQLPEQYQGIVKLNAKNLSKILENYFYQSEQVHTFVFLCANEKRACGFFLQALPFSDSDNPLENKNHWEHLSTLAETITAKELLSLSSHEMLFRLFHQEKLSLLDTQPLYFYCHCSRDRMGKAIVNLGLEDARKLILEQPTKKITVTCEFCNAKVEFDSIDVENIFHQEPPHDKLS